MLVAVNALMRAVAAVIRPAEVSPLDPTLTDVAVKVPTRAVTAVSDVEVKGPILPAIDTEGTVKE